MEIDDFVLLLNRKGFKPRTQEGYRQVLGHFHRFLKGQGKTDLRGVTRNDLNSYRLLLAQTFPSLETRRTYLRRVRAFFRFLQKENGVLFNPAEGLFVGKSPGPRRLPVVLTSREMTKLLSLPFENYRLGLRDRAALELLYSSGLRVGEAIRLRPEHLNFREGVVLVEQGKGEKDRVVPLGGKAGEALTDYLQNLRPRLNGKQRNEVFLSYRGRPLDKNEVGWILKKHARACGITKRIYPHLFRHTMATHLLEKGADLHLVQGILGHSRVETTQLYTQVRPVELKRWYNRCHPQAKFLKEKTWRQALCWNPTSVIGRLRETPSPIG